MGSSNPTLKAPRLLESALAYAARGWLCIPVGSDKKPCDPATGRLLTDWVNQGSDDPLVLTQRFAHARPGLGVGILTGAVSGIVVIDEDQKPGKDGRASLSRLEQYLGSLPPTLMARTPSGGHHYIFKYPTGLAQPIRNRTSIGKTLLKQSQTWVDVRADGGQIVAAPTQRDGVSYEWLSDPLETPIAELPEAWVDLLISKEVQRRESMTMADGHIQEGGRNEALFIEGCSLRGKGLDETSILAVLLSRNETLCRPPLPVHEVEAIARSVMRYDSSFRYELNDTGNGKRFADKFRHRVRYQVDRERWFLSDGTRWAEDTTREIDRLAQQIGSDIEAEGKLINDAAIRKAVLGWARRSGDRARLKAILDIGSTDSEIACQSVDFDNVPWRLPVLNGVVDLQTGKLLPHDPSMLLSKVAPCEYNPGAVGPKFKAFLERVQPDPEVRRFLQRLLGYSLVGQPLARTFPVFQGRGANGKSTLLDIIGEVVKPFVKKTAASTFLAKDKESTIRSDHAILQGSRLVIGSETPSRRKLDSVAIKSLTGDREFTARPLWAPEITFSVTFMVTMMTNPLPHVDETDSALWDRLVLVPFDVSIPKDERIKDLVEIIVREEASGVLSWLVGGAVEYFELNDLAVPQICVDRSRQWRKLVGSIERFMDEECHPDTGRIALGDLHRYYRLWAQRQHVDPYGIESFRQRLAELGVQIEDRGAEESVTGLRIGKPAKLVMDQMVA